MLCRFISSEIASSKHAQMLYIDRYLVIIICFLNALFSPLPSTPDTAHTKSNPMLAIGFYKSKNDLTM